MRHFENFSNNVLKEIFLRNILVFTVVYLPFLVEIRVVNMDQQRIQIVYEGIFLVNRYLKNEEWMGNLKRETTFKPAGSTCCCAQGTAMYKSTERTFTHRLKSFKV